MSGLTPEQEAAVAAEGDVLVVAGAGTGKTRTLVERCLRRMEGGPQAVGIDRMLVVTFTEAAAAELRKRIRRRLEEWLGERPGDSWLTEQLALLERARVSTLHGFCLQLVRDHFHRLGIDPDVTVLSEEQSVLVARETLEELLRRQYRGEFGGAELFQQLVLDHGRGWDEPVRQLILRLHRHARSLRDPAAWFDRELSCLEGIAPERWVEWLVSGFEAWREEWLEELRGQPSAPAQQCLAVLEAARGCRERKHVAEALRAVLAADSDALWPKGKKIQTRKPLERFFADAAFLESLAEGEADGDPLQQDWSWVREPARALLGFARRFGHDYAAAKRALGAVDFADLEQFALELLWDRVKERPTPLAEELRQQIDLVLVDEYQDINEAQDTILRALGREDGAANRFLVGDVKQSIYRFRLADPRIFRDYMKDWGRAEGRGRALHLSDNFRSHEAILEFVNQLFRGLMRPELGGVAYDRPQHLRFGAAEERAVLRKRGDDPPRVELHLLLTERKLPTETDARDAEGEPPAQPELEAACIGRRLAELRARGFQVWDAEAGRTRSVCWQDMAILMRAPAGKAEAYAKVFERLGIPLHVARGGFYEATEITDLLSILEVLDNPLQDLPLLAVLRSPWLAFAPDELALIRLSAPRTYYWTALRRFHRQHRAPAERSVSAPGVEAAVVEAAWRKADRFLAAYRAWRRRIREEPLSGCLESILDETGYEAWLLAQLRGSQRQANVHRLLELTRQFDEFQRQGLFRFLRFVEAQTQAGIDLEPALPAGTDAVRLLSIHQSKGLEFPVVVVADLGKPFNFRDLRQPVILDEYYGLCLQVHPPDVSGRYPSLPYWLAERRQRREALGEETRLLYVACTRACDLLLLSGSIAARRVEERWHAQSERCLQRLLTAGSGLDLLGVALPEWTGPVNWLADGTHEGFGWRAYPPGAVVTEPITQPLPDHSSEPARARPSADELQGLERRVNWQYPFRTATLEPAKTTVSALRRRADAERDEDAMVWAPSGEGGGMSGAEVGVGYHSLLERVDLAGAGDVPVLRAEARRLAAEGLLEAGQVEALDFEAIASFWQSPVGAGIRAEEPRRIHRELPFTARFGIEELAGLGLFPLPEGLAGLEAGPEWVVVQGVVDLAVIRDAEIWVLDFKTDRTEDLAAKIERYRPQLRLYAGALERIYRRPVTHRWIHFFNRRQTVDLLD